MAHHFNFRASQLNTALDPVEYGIVVPSLAVDGQIFWRVVFLFSHALLVGEDPEEEDFTDCRLPIDLIVEMTHFLDLEKTPLPPPAFGFAPLPDLSPEGIEKARAEALRDLEQHR